MSSTKKTFEQWLEIKEPHTFTVSSAYESKTVAAFIKKELNCSWAKSKDLIAKSRIKVNRQKIADEDHRLHEGDRVTLLSHQKQSEKSKVQDKKFQDAIEILHVDSDIVVVEKPAGIPSVRHLQEAKEFGEKAVYLPKTLHDLLPFVLRKKGFDKRKGTAKPLKAVHRLDKETSGVMVFARSSKAASHLAQQFKDHTIHRKYQAIVQGVPQDQTIQNELVRDRGDGYRGSGKGGKTAITHIKVLEKFAGYSLVECALETGRTHQIRIHLAELHHPVCGERIYLKLFKQRSLIDSSEFPRLALHATFLEFEHPKTSQKMSFSSALPKSFRRFIQKRKEK